MNAKEDTGISFAINTLDDIPKPSANAKEITGLVKQGGKVTGYQLSDNRIVNEGMRWLQPERRVCVRF